MAVPNQNPESQHTGNGATTVFAYGFLLLAAGDLQVYVNGVLQTLGMHYTVSGVGTPTGGAVTFGSAPANGLKVLLLRQVTASRTTDYQYAGDFQARVVNLDFDRLWMAIQDALARFASAIRFPRGENALNSILPRASLRARKAVIFDAQGNVTVSVDDYNEQASDAAASAQEAKEARDQVVAIAENFDDQAQERLDQIEADGEAVIDKFKVDGTAALRAIGRYPPVPYSAMLAMTSVLQTVAYMGQTYAPRADMIPFTTSGTFETAKFQLVQGVSGADLAAREGLPILGYNATEAQAILDNGYPLVSIAQLRTFTGPARRVTITGVAGRAKPDPRSGPLDLMPGDTTTADNDVDVYVDGAGRRWKRPHEGWVYAGWAGAMGDGVTEDRAALQKALDTGYSVYCDKKAVYRCSSTLTQKTPVQCLDGRGSWLDAYALPSNTPLIVFDPTLDPSWPVDFQPSNVRGLRHMVLMGPGKAGGGASYEGTSIGIRAGAPHVPVQGVMIYGFGVGVELPSFSYIQGWDLCNIAQCGIGIYAKSGGSDYGERLVYSRCCIYDNKLAIKNDCPTGALQFDHCSVDYNLKTLEASNGSMTELNGTWVECNDAGAGKVHMSLATGAQLTMTGGRLQQNGTPGALAQDAFLSVDATARASFRDIFAFNLRNSANVFSIGAGLVEFDGVKSYPVSYLPSKISPVANNRLSDSGFTLTSVVDLWSIVTDTAAITDRLAGANTSLSSSADVAHTGTRSLKVHKLAGGAPGSFVLAVPVKPGSRAAFTLWHTKPNQASSGGAVFLTSAAARIEGVKTGGVPNILNTVNFDTFLLSNTDNYIPWTEFGSGMDRVIPSWATHFLLYFNTDAFQGDFYLDDVFIGVM